MDVTPLDSEPAVLRPLASQDRFELHLFEPPAALAPFVNNLWTVTWELPPGESYVAQTLPFPSVNLTVTNSETDVTGLVRRRYDRHLTGSGYAVGARFRPACFRPFVDWPVSRLTDSHRPISDVLGRATSALAAQVAAEADQQARVDLLVDFLTADLPARDADAERLADVVEQIAARRDVTRVAQVAALAGRSIRSLQREFLDYVGAGPKWVIQRYRLQEAAARVTTGEPVDWAAVAHELGYADQAHLTRAFTTVIGVPPAAYARQERAAAGQLSGQAAR